MNIEKAKRVVLTATRMAKYEASQFFDSNAERLESFEDNDKHIGFFGGAITAADGSEKLSALAAMAMLASRDFRLLNLSFKRCTPEIRALLDGVILHYRNSSRMPDINAQEMFCAGFVCFMAMRDDELRRAVNTVAENE